MSELVQQRQTFSDYVAARQSQIERALLGKPNAQAIIASICNTFERTPALHKCSYQSVYQCMIQLAELGLEAGTALQFAHLIPRGNECTVNVDYRGYLELLRRADVTDIVCNPVYKDDVVEWTEGVEFNFVHKPSLKARTAENLIAVYFMCKVPGSSRHFLDYMDRSEIDQVRNLNRNSQAWKEHYVRMALKSVVRRAVNYLPRTTDLSAMQQMDISYDIDHAPSVKEAAPSPKPAIEASDVEKLSKRQNWLLLQSGRYLGLGRAATNDEISSMNDTFFAIEDFDINSNNDAMVSLYKILSSKMELNLTAQSEFPNNQSAAVETDDIVEAETIPAAEHPEAFDDHPFDVDPAADPPALEIGDTEHKASIKKKSNSLDSFK